jgi:hypothetical protein
MIVNISFALGCKKVDCYCKKIVTVGFGLCFRLVAGEWFNEAKVLLLNFAGYFCQKSLDLVIPPHPIKQGAEGEFMGSFSYGIVRCFTC